MPITSTLNFPRSALFLVVQHPYLRGVIEAVASIEDSQLGNGDFELPGYGFTVASYVGATTHRNGSLEEMQNHRRLVDLHVVIDGQQDILYAPAKDLSVTKSYEEQRDFEMLKAPQEYGTITLDPGAFTLLFPGEAHSPRWQHDPATTFVKTAIVKIPLVTLRQELKPR